jgi:hypothetical protein
MTFKSRRRRRGRWDGQNRPDALRRRSAATAAKREAFCAALPPAYAEPTPLSVWVRILVLDGAGRPEHELVAFVPACHARCDQHAATVDGERRDAMLTATEIGRIVAGWVPKRPSFAEMAELRRDLGRASLDDLLDAEAAEQDVEGRRSGA